MTAAKEHVGNGILDEIIEKMEAVRDSVEEVLDELEELDERRQYYGSESPYGMPLDEDYNGDA